MNLVLFGPPGSGKGTYGTRLEPILKVKFLITSSVLKETAAGNSGLGKEIMSYMTQGKLVPDEIVNEVMKQRLTQSDVGTGFILDGYPRTVNQAETMDKIAKLHALVVLNVSQDIIVTRLSARLICRNCGAIYNKLTLPPKIEGKCDKCGGELYQRDDDKPEVVSKRFKVYEEQTAPVIEYYKNKIPFVELNVTELNMPPEEGIERIVLRMKELGLISQ